MWSHPTEEQFAIILDYLDIEWEYEPHEIILEEEDGRILRAFKPDFYLPHGDIYIEITTSKSMSKKNKKMNLMALHHPDVNIFLINKSMLEEILQKYNFLWSSV